MEAYTIAVVQSRGVMIQKEETSGRHEVDMNVGTDGLCMDGSNVNEHHPNTCHIRTNRVHVYQINSANVRGYTRKTFLGSFYHTSNRRPLY